MKKWKCKVCGYIHEGPEPPDTCPVCGVSKDYFEEIKDAGTVSGTQPKPSSVPAVPPVQDGGNAKEALFKIGYGLYVVTSLKDGKLNGQTCNTVFQITSEPARVAVGINKNNLTHEYIKASGVLAVTVLGKGNVDLVKHFGFQSGRNTDKFQGKEYFLASGTGCPVLNKGSAYLDCRVIPELSLDLGTHTLFIVEVVDGNLLRGSETMTYEFYRNNRAKPEKMLQGDVQNVITTLNLEYGANRRYEYQIGEIQNPRINAVLEGVMRTEGDHVDSSLGFLKKRLAPEIQGFADVLLHLKLNLDFEEVATATYRQFAREAETEDLKTMFAAMARSEAGHVHIFKKMIEEIEKGQFPVVFYCPLCGWEIDYGPSPQEAATQRCSRCGAAYALRLVEGNWTLEEA